MNIKFLKFLFTIKHVGYLYELGWIKSFLKGSPINEQGQPIPWMTYPLIKFLDKRINKNQIVFEYGSGNSTLYFSNYVEKVVAIEHDLDWFNKINSRISDNIELIYKVLRPGGEYSKTVNTLGQDFSIIIIDGRDRVNCIYESVLALDPSGVIILDDSEREDYQEGRQFLFARGFKEIEFWGISPGLFYEKCTSIFYRQNNCFNI